MQANQQRCTNRLTKEGAEIKLKEFLREVVEGGKRAERKEGVGVQAGEGGVIQEILPAIYGQYG